MEAAEQSWPRHFLEPTQASLPCDSDDWLSESCNLDTSDATLDVEATGFEAADGGQDGRAFLLGGANQQLAAQAVQVQASHGQERRPQQQQDLTAPRNVWLHPEQTLTIYETGPSDAQSRHLCGECARRAGRSCCGEEEPGAPPKQASLTFRAESNESPGLDWQSQPRLPFFYYEDGDASMLVAPGAS